jgi:hypothetical protein
MVALVELASPILVKPFQIGHADIGVMASLTVHKLHTMAEPASTAAMETTRAFRR